VGGAFVRKLHGFALAAVTLCVLVGTLIAEDYRASERQIDSAVAVRQQGGNNVIIGTVRRVETLERTVTISDYWGRAMAFTVKDSGSIFRSKDSMDQFATIYDLKPGVQVQVTYTGIPENPDRIRIVILQNSDYLESVPR
jgi:hypothetical protein